MTDPFAHLKHPDVVAAEVAWERHVRGGDGELPCPDCQQGERRACEVGRALHEACVTAAHKTASLNREAGA